VTASVKPGPAGPGSVPVTLGSGYFDAMYRAASDPWGFENRWYERRKYALSLALLPAERYRSAFEPGCSIGVFSELLAPRCDALLCCDVAAAAVRAAAERTRGLPQVRVERCELPGQWPAGRFDLVVFSELLYYFGDHDLEQLLRNAVASVADYPRSGDDVHGAIAALPGLARLVSHAEPDFLAEVYIRSDGAPVSVAQATGLV